MQIYRVSDTLFLNLDCIGSVMCGTGISPQNEEAPHAAVYMTDGIKHDLYGRDAERFQSVLERLACKTGRV